DQLVSQRSRWINSWFKYVNYGVELFFLGMYKLSWNQFLFGIVLSRPPLFMFLLTGFVCLAVNLFLSPNVAIIWAILYGFFLVTFLIALRAQGANPEIYRALFSVPKFVALQLWSLLRVRRASQRSIATKHVTIKINSST